MNEKVKKIARLIRLMETKPKIARSMKTRNDVGQHMFAQTLANIDREIRGLKMELSL